MEYCFKEKGLDYQTCIEELFKMLAVFNLFKLLFFWGKVLTKLSNKYSFFDFHQVI